MLNSKNKRLDKKENEIEHDDYDEAKPKHSFQEIGSLTSTEFLTIIGSSSKTELKSMFDEFQKVNVYNSKQLEM